MRGEQRDDFSAAKEAVNLAKHGLSFEDAALLFEGACQERRDLRFPYGEERLVALGPPAKFGDHICVVVYT